MTRKEKLIILAAFFLTVFFLILSWVPWMCISENPSLAEAIAMVVMQVGATVALVAYWAFWIFWDKKRWDKSRKLHRTLLICAAVLSLTRYFYSGLFIPCA